MSLIANFKLMAEYNLHMNKQIYAASFKLKQPELTADRGAFFGSILGTLNHILVGDIIWLQRFAKASHELTSLDDIVAMERPASLDAVIFDDLVLLAKSRFKVDQDIQGFTHQLTEKLINSPLAFNNVKGESFSKNFGFLVQHLFNHQTHHRGQVSTLFNQIGIDIGVTDLLDIIPKVNVD
ncbi:DinB family protein [Paraglaciecola sp.]|uniref:DinB family protein n=1 Tax=Paraglaciecola sp. TaxID=1920173 RepID=UPI003EF9FDEA